MTVFPVTLSTGITRPGYWETQQELLRGRWRWWEVEGKSCGNVLGSVVSAAVGLSAWAWRDTKPRFYGVSSSAGFSLLCDVMLSVSVIFIAPGSVAGTWSRIQPQKVWKQPLDLICILSADL